MCFVNAMKRYSDGRFPLFRLRRIGKYSTNSGPATAGTDIGGHSYWSRVYN